jgi:hypothetical protein
MSRTVFTAKHSTLGKYRQTVKSGRSGASYGGIGKNTVVEGDINTVMMTVESYRLHINIGVEQIRTAYPCPSGRVQYALGAFGEIDSQILNAILIPTAISDFSGVNGKGLLQILRPARTGLLTVFRHGNTSRNENISHKRL